MQLAEIRRRCIPTCDDLGSAIAMAIVTALEVTANGLEDGGRLSQPP
jgi:hypothetical protein